MTAKPTFDEATQNEILMHENPRHASRLGLDRKEIAGGYHQPSGSTTQPEPVKKEFLGAADKEKQVVMFVELFGHRKAGMDILEASASRHNQETIISGIAQASGKLIGLTAELNAKEKRGLADLGAKLYSADMVELRVRSSEGSRPHPQTRTLDA